MTKDQERSFLRYSDFIISFVLRHSSFVILFIIVGGLASCKKPGLTAPSRSPFPTTVLTRAHSWISVTRRTT